MAFVNSHSFPGCCRNDKAPSVTTTRHRLACPTGKEVLPATRLCFLPDKLARGAVDSFVMSANLKTCVPAGQAGEGTRGRGDEGTKRLYTGQLFSGRRLAVSGSNSLIWIPVSVDGLEWAADFHWRRRFQIKRFKMTRTAIKPQ